MTSVASRNPFALLGDSEEAEPVVKEQEPTPAKETVVVKKVDRSRASPKEARIRFDYPQRGSYKSSASNRSEDTRSAPRDRNVGPRLAGRREEGGGGGGGDYPTRNSRGARPNDRGRGGRGGRRGREFDRHSGTGRYDSEKKETQAWGNVTASYDTNESPGWNETTETSGWNNNTTETSGWNDNTTETSGWNDATETSEPSGWNESTTDNNAGGWDEGKTEEKSGWDVDNAGDNNEVWVEQPEVIDDSKAEQAENATTSESAPVRELEEEVKTFDEYLAEKAQKSLDITLPEARKPNEGTDDSQWKNAVPLEKDEDEDFLFAGKEQSYRLKNKKSKSKNFLEIEPTFTERSGGGPSRGRGRGRGGRGGRGGRDDGRSHRDNYDNDNRDNRDNRRRGGGGRSGYAGIVNLDDQRAFPSLSAEKV